MQPTTQLPHEQKQSMSWGQFIPSTLFAFWGTGFITTFLILPLIMYKSIFADKTQIALYESIIDTTGTALQLIILLFSYLNTSLPKHYYYHHLTLVY